MVPSISEVSLNAGNEITLDLGFETEDGANFIAQLQDCTIPLCSGKYSGGEKERENENNMFENTVVYGTRYELNGSDEISKIEQQSRLNPTNVSIYPNPNTGTFTVSFNDEAGKNRSVSLYNILGEEIYSRFEITDKMLIIDLLDHSKGIYYIKVEQDSGVQVKTIIHH